MTKSCRQLRMGLHGYGFIGRTHVLASQLSLASSRPCPHIVWDTAVVHDLASPAAALARQTFRTVTDDVHAFLREDLDAVSIASPNDAHMAALASALQNRLAVYCEKPLSGFLDESRRMAEMVEAAGVVHQVALMYRFHPAVIDAYHWLRSGRLGRVLTFRAELLHGGYLDPNRPMAWRLRQAQAGGGALTDLGVHLIDLLLHLLGPVQRLATELRTFVSSRPGSRGSEAVTVDDWALARLDMQSGAVGTLEVSRVHVGRERDGIEIVCEGGVLYIPLDREARAEIWSPTGEPLSGPTLDSHPVLAPMPAKFAQTAHLNAHAVSIAVFALRAAGEEIAYPVPTFHEALAAERLVDAMRTSAEEGGKLVTVST
ncbi:dehydrogenase [Alicyclobacillus hesperidum]|uniref:Dehydrogenase n=1 Tax=Alicyclobacillus hesperidum TaxID=89784 RepID=A0AA37X1E0_9BACL|nr:Gfo/Idh/MocA family oxidoreductase [Alicyclobacillus hesperidum]GLV13401.1 dehydrogenase [Alicyclobacillus hesperidum]